MVYRFRGKLCGVICNDCVDGLSKVKVRLYRLRDKQISTVLATANPKNTFSVLTDERVKEKESFLLAETNTDEQGGFNFELGDGYDGGPFEIDVFISSSASQEKPAKSIQFSITTLQPQWRVHQDSYVWAWQYCIPSRYWCRIKELLGEWTVCGRVVHCETGKPIGGVKVIAFDRDWLQDDSLGSAVTNALGYFRIDYSEADFKQGTFIDVELFGGPDLYFHIETLTGTPLLTELPSKGREPGRENVGPCFCVRLCVKEQPPVIEPLPVFTHIGGYHYSTQINSAPSGNGLTMSDGRAFYSTNRLNGILSKKLNGQPMEYQFEYLELNSSGGPIGTWQPIDPTMIRRTVIGIWEIYAPLSPSDPNPIKTKVYTVKGTAGPNEMVANIVGGWIQVPQQSNVFGPEGFFQPNGNMIRLNSKKLAVFSDINLSGLTTGNSSTSTGQPLAENKHFSIRMKVRAVGSATETVGGVCEHIAINNTLYDNMEHHPAWMPVTKSDRLAVAMVDINQLVSNGCAGITNALDVVFTAAHPTLGNVSISMSGPGGPYSFTLPPIATPGNHFGTVTPNFSVAGLAPCAYIVTLSVQLLLTTGDSIPDNLFDQIAFCK